MCELSGGACSGLGASRKTAGKGEAVQGELSAKDELLIERDCLLFPKHI